MMTTDDFGVIEFKVDGYPVSATLSHDRTWRVDCKNAVVKRWVEVELGEIAVRRHGPEDGFYGPVKLQQAVDRFGGRIVKMAEIEQDYRDIY
jgi:hypothetical protein